MIIKCNDVNDHQIAIMTDGSSVVSEAIVSIKLAQISMLQQVEAR